MRRGRDAFGGVWRDVRRWTTLESSQFEVMLRRLNVSQGDVKAPLRLAQHVTKSCACHVVGHQMKWRRCLLSSTTDAIRRRLEQVLGRPSWSRSPVIDRVELSAGTLGGLLLTPSFSCTVGGCSHVSERHAPRSLSLPLR